MAAPPRNPVPPAPPTERGLLAVSLLLAVTLLWVHRDFFTDDAYISLRYALRFAQGDGPVWNAGDVPNEGYSNPLLVALTAGVMAAGGDGVAFVRWLGIGSCLLTLPALWALARRRLGGMTAALATLLVGGSPAVAFWAGGGLETALCTLLATIGVLAADDDDGGHPWRAGLVLAALPLLRPEAVGWILPFALVSGLVRWGRGSGRAAFGVAVAIGLPSVLAMVGVEAVRWGLYGHLVPNSVVFKARAGSGDSIPMDFLRQAWPALLLVVPGLIRLPRHLAPIAVPPLVLFAASPFFLNSVNEYGRFFLPVWPLWALLAAHGAVVLSRRFAAPLVVLAGVLIATVGEASLFETGWLLERYSTCKSVARANAGDWLREHQAPGDVYAIADAGLVPWRADGQAYDIFGLNDPEVQRDGYMEPEPRARRVLDVAPTWIILTSGNGVTLRPRYEVERAIARHPEFARSYEIAERIDGEACNYWLHIYRRRSSP